VLKVLLAMLISILELKAVRT